MSKRLATSELNHDNWNDEAEAEEAGTFKVASTDQLKDRKFIKPKRRLGQTSSTGSSTDNPFTAFSSFASVAASAKPFESFTFGNVSSGTANDSSEAESPISVPEQSSPSVNIFGGSVGNSPTNNEPAKFSFATGLPFTPQDKSGVTTTTPSWKFGIDVSEDTEPDSTNEKSNEEVGNVTDSTTEASVESENRDSNDDAVVSESDKSSELTNTSGQNNEAHIDEDEEENDNEPDSTEQDDEESGSKED